MAEHDRAEHDYDDVADHDYDLTRKADIKEWLSDINNEISLYAEWSVWFRNMSHLPYHLTGDEIRNNVPERIQEEVKIKMYRSLKYIWGILDRIHTILPELMEN